MLQRPAAPGLRIRRPLRMEAATYQRYRVMWPLVPAKGKQEDMQ